MIDYDNSVVIIGGVGVGKSLVSNRLSAVTGLEVVNVDEYRHLPTIKEIKKVLGDPHLPPPRRDEFLHYKHLREKHPNIRNYRQFGFKPEISQYLEHNFGKVAWHYYQKAFENMLMQDICENVSGAVILDVGGGMPVCLDREYDRLRAKFESLDRKLFYREFNHLDWVNKEVTHGIYTGFKNVIHLETPEHKSDRSDRALDNVLNRYFLASMDYEKVARTTIDTTGLFVGGKYVDSKLDSIIDTIEESMSSTGDIEESM